MLTILSIIGLICAIALSAMFSGLETAAYTAKKFRLSTLARKGDTTAARVLKTLSDMSGLIIALLICNNITIDLGTYLVTTHLEFLGIDSAELLTTLILTPVYFIFAETLPKQIAHCYPNEFLRVCSRISVVMHKSLKPFSYILGFFGLMISIFLRRLGVRQDSATGKNFLAESLEANAYEGVLNPQQYEMAQKIISLENLTISDMMLPTKSAVTVCASQTAASAGKAILSSGFVRALIVNERDELSGKLVTLNGIMRSANSLEQPVENVAIEAMRIDSKTPVVKAITRMRESGSRLAVAVNSGGTPVGVVPFSRLVGSITGVTKL